MMLSNGKEKNASLFREGESLEARPPSTASCRNVLRPRGDGRLRHKPQSIILDKVRQANWGQRNFGTRPYQMDNTTSKPSIGIRGVISGTRDPRDTCELTFRTGSKDGALRWLL